MHLGLGSILNFWSHPFGFAQGRLCRSKTSSDKSGATVASSRETVGQPPSKIPRTSKLSLIVE